MVDFGDGTRRLHSLVWEKRITAFEALRLASEKVHGFEIKFTGSGATTFITEIDGQANDNTGQVAQNWMFFVNGELCTVSCGVYELKPSDIVRWVYMVMPNRK